MQQPIVAVIEDDPIFLDIIVELITGMNLQVLSFHSAEAFEEKCSVNVACIVMDVRLPGISGVNFQKKLNLSRSPVPIILMSGYCDVRMAVQAMKDGAAHFLSKPINNQELLDAIFSIVHEHASGSAFNHDKKYYYEQLEALTKREFQIYSLLIKGHASKEVAALLYISKNTVEVHRANVLKKMKVPSVVKLIAQSVSFQFNQCSRYRIPASSSIG